MVIRFHFDWFENKSEYVRTNGNDIDLAAARGVDMHSMVGGVKNKIALAEKRERER